ncbi:Hypothetical predicted protein [Mytilus galloprovincialis]|uniref:Uncharacterized protein n=1 Tax=Mytilus galloprovincialis TaxID=29158 RepID=A0A8B6F341_MYTGA|nr:Hypothetical predicted protein [Mytilus galloprovincialis]
MWGVERKDLVTVCIVCEDSNKRNTQRRFVAVEFKSQPRTPIEHPIYKQCNLRDTLSVQEETVKDVSEKLLPLMKTMDPLKHLIKGLPQTRNSWDILEDKYVAHGLCHNMMIAFLYNMDDTNGKNAMASLLGEIINKLGLDEQLSVVSTGSTSRRSFCSTSVRLEVSRYSSSGESPPKPASKINKELQQTFPQTDSGKQAFETNESVVTPSKNVQITPESSPGSTLSSSSDESSAHLTTEDVLVYSAPNQMTSPIQSSLVVSIKKGDACSQTQCLQNLLSRLPYQKNKLFGLSINAVEAAIYSIELTDDSVKLCSYNDYIFRKFGKSFCVDSFSEFVIDIGLILYSSTQ